MKKRKLSTKVILVVVFFALLIIVATCLSVVLRYRKDIMERYSWSYGVIFFTVFTAENI